MGIVLPEDPAIPLLGIYPDEVPTYNNEFMKFLGKWMDLECFILSEVTQSQKNSHDMHSLIGGY